MKVIIMRGLPGAGKSTFVKKNYPDAVICSADKYFINKHGEYKFDPGLIGEAHIHCLQTFLYFITTLKEKLIVIDNTNVTTTEWIPYYRIAETMGYSCEIIEVFADPKICVERNIHGVPKSTIDNMARKWQPVPKWIKNVEKVNND
jgi:predicted kinase